MQDVQADSSAGELARGCLGAHLEVVEALRNEPFLEVISAVGDAMVRCYQGNGKAIFFGNGGSAADSMHLAAEFLGRFLLDRRPAGALALADNHSAVTAIGNDYAYEEVFSRQIQALAAPGDIAVGLSTSGTSPNVIAGLAAARAAGATTVAFTGADGVPSDVTVDHVVAIPSRATPRIQEGHMLVGHILCEYVERVLLVNR
jgi:D-sedoheptulose 7-phosphate isomerase